MTWYGYFVIVDKLRITISHFLNSQYMSSSINYEKRKNQKLFQHLEKQGICHVQNYIPIYKNFFLLNENNYNSINLNHHQYVKEVIRKEDENIYKCKLAGSSGDTKTNTVFFKFAPLLDPIKYMIGKYPPDNIEKLPSLNTSKDEILPKVLDVNNSAYVDGYFSALSNQLFETRNFVHGVKFYGSFLGIKKKFNVNVYDDIDYLAKSVFFNKHKNKLFEIEDYEALLDDEDETSRCNLRNLNISNDTVGDTLDVEEIDAVSFDNVFLDESTRSEIDKTSPEKDLDCKMVPLTIDNMATHNITANTEEMGLLPVKHGSVVLANESDSTSDDSCSSRTSHTGGGEGERDDTSIQLSDMEKGTACNVTGDNGTNEMVRVTKATDSDDSDGSGDCSDDSGDDSSDYDSDDETLIATFPAFPVQLICMEHCDATMDDIIMDDELGDQEWLSMLMQIIMTLIAYQKAFSFTHNDLHTNNVMFIPTKRKYLYYKFKDTHYRVPTFGKIFKIIDFGRAIYKYDGKIMCSDSFGPGGDASTQYNTEPYHNPEKPRLEPNFSFDLCRLACSIFDYLIEDVTEMKPLHEYGNITRIIAEWCLDDDGLNMLYKKNGAERYPDFKLYKMIARRVHHHTPTAQLDRPEFKSYVCNEDDITGNERVMDLDAL